MVKKFISLMITIVMSLLSVAPVFSFQVNAEESPLGIWHTETANGASYCWKVELIGGGGDQPLMYRLTLKGNGDECIVPETGFEPWEIKCNMHDLHIRSIVIEPTFTDFKDYMFANPSLTDITILGNHYNDNNRENDIPYSAFINCENLKVIFGNAPTKIDTSNYFKGFEAYSGETHLADMDPQYLAAYYGCEYIDINDIVFDDFSFTNESYIRCILDLNGDFWFYNDVYTLNAEINFVRDSNPDILSEYRSMVKNIHFLNEYDSSVIIGENCFKDCVNLETVNFPELYISSIKSGAFENCTSLKEFTFPILSGSSDESTDGGFDNLFVGCTSLEKVVFPDLWGDWLDNVFTGCTALKEIKLPEDTILSIGLDGCDSLEEIIVPDATEGLNLYLNDSIKTVILPPDIDYIRLYENGLYTTQISNPDFKVYSTSDVTSSTWGYCNNYNIPYEDISRLFNITENNGGFEGSSYMPPHNTDENIQPDFLWKLDAEGTLTITPNSSTVMEHIQNELLVPWRYYFDQIKNVVIEDGMTQILGDYFSVCVNLESIQIPATVYNMEYTGISPFANIKAHKDSYAYLFALRNEYNFTEIPREYKYLSGINNWSFLNTEEFFRSNENHFILDSFREKLLANTDDIEEISPVSNTERKRIEKMLDSRWNGSCWGMAVTSILSCYENFDFSSFDKNASVLHDLENTEEIESLLNYYWALQFTNEMRAQIQQYKQQKDIVKMEDLMKNVTSEKPTLLAYSFPEGSHAVVAYGYTVSDDGGYTFEIDGDTYTYDIRINLYDNITDNQENLNPDACMYVNTSNPKYFQWYIPLYNAVHNSRLEKNNSGSISFVCSDINTLNYHGYINGTYENSSLDYTASLETDSINGISFKEDNANGNVMMNMEKIAVYDGEYPTDEKYRFSLENSESGCSVQLNSDNNQTLTMDYAGCMLSVNADEAEKVEFQPDDEYITIIGNKSSYNMELVFNNEFCITDWYDINISSDTESDRLCIKKADAEKYGRNGYILNSSEPLGRFFVETESNSSTTQISCNTNCKSVLLYQYDSDTIGILADSDNDGIYESDISDTEYSIADIVYLQKYLLGMTTFSKFEHNFYNLLSNNDEVNVFDIIALKRIILNK